MAREWQIPGGPYINEAAVRQWQIPGGPYINDTFVSGASTMPAAVGTFTLTGRDAEFDYSGDNPILDADTATPYVVSGGNFTVLRRGKTIVGAVGTFELEVAPSLSDVELDAEKGTFTLTGIATGLAHGYKITAAVGTFTLTGGEFVGIPSSSQKTLGAETGVFTLTGIDATLARESVTLTAETGEFELTGIDIVGGYEFSVETGEFVIDDKTATFTIGGPTRWTRRTRPVTGWQRRS
jgi:hypothetical protein